VLLDYAFAFVHITAFTVAKATKAVLVNVVGAAGPPDLANLEKDEEGETAPAQEFYGALGRIAAPRRPTKLGKDTIRVEGVAARRGDGLVPIAVRDLRLHAFFPNPKEGTIADVGYAGAFASNEPTFNADGTPKSTVWTLYVPFAFNGSGVPTKAHVFTIDSTTGNVAISLVHADGMGLLMTAGGKNSAVLRNKAGNAYVEVNDDGVTVNGQTVVNGGLAVGPVGATPAAVATPVQTYLTALETLLAAIAAATVPPTTAAVTAFVSAQAATKTAIAATLTTIK
jgi:hypothetical protein